MAPLPDATPLIRMRGVGKDYANGEGLLTVLDGIDLDIAEGEFVAILGPSGSGKSTLMHLLGALDQPSRGSYQLAGQDVMRLDGDGLAALRRDTLGFVFQRYHLVGNDTALQNVEMPAVYSGLEPGERRTRARALLERLGLGERLRHRPGQLSGGQQQRVSIARALMNGGRVVLADEPTGALDAQSGREVMALLRELHQAGHTVLLVTHDENVAAHAERRIVLQGGRIVSDSGPVGPARATPPSVAAQPRPASAWRDLGEAAQLSLRALRVQLLRTCLTLLGIVIGVGSVVAMLALGDGSKAQVLARIEAMGTDLLVVRPGARNVRTKDEGASLLPEDAEAIAQLPGVRRVVPEYSAGVTARANGNDLTTLASGTTPELVAARHWPLAAGSFFTETDARGAAAVAVLGHSVAQQLFGPETDPVGSFVLLNNVPFRILGVLEPKGANASGNDQDDFIAIPLPTARMRLFGKRYLRNATVQVDDVQASDAVQAAIRQLLVARHGKEDFQVRNMASLLETASETQNTLTLLLGAIAAISLVVGGIGVMNIMLVSVTERVREIGVRIACGARMRHIMLQFNLEALLVCLVGGLAGVAIGLGAAATAAHFGAAVAYRWPPVAIALGSAMAIGLLFGFLPARRAALLDPVQALASD